MNDAARQAATNGDDNKAHTGATETLSPLPGEIGIPNLAAPQRSAISKKGLLAVGLLVGSLIAVSAVSIQRFAGRGHNVDEGGRLVRDKPTAASTEPRKLELPAPVSAATTSTQPRIPALAPTDADEAEPIGVRRTGAAPAGSPSSSSSMKPEDAPMLLVTTRPGAPVPTGIAGPQRSPRGISAEAHPDAGEEGDALSATTRNLQAYQQQLQGVLDSLTRTADLATPTPTSLSAPPAVLGAPQSHSGNLSGGSPAGGGLFGGQLPSSATPRASAALIGNRSLILPKGTAGTCALKTRVISATSGLVSCQLQRDIYGDDGRVLLVERGSHFDGEYRIASVRPGMVRIPILWTRVRTPFGVVVDLDSPATGKLGESGIDGYVDNRWSERIGAALLLSLIDDSVKLVIQSQSNDRQADTIVLPSTTANSSKLAEKVLDSTINIPPLVYQNQGGIVGIYVARDVDFSSVYELVPAGGRSSRATP